MKLSIGARAQAFVLLALVATAGALAGMAGQRAFGQHTPGEPRDSAVQDGRRAPAAEGRYAERLTGSLELTPAQEDAIDEIVAEEQARVRELTEEVQPRFRAIADETRDRIESVLTAEQRVRLRELREQRVRQGHE
jgi:Spy/CpxP family protein refolding chaperone